MKKWTGVALVLALLVSITACGGASRQAPAEADSSAPEAGSAETPATPGAEPAPEETAVKAGDAQERTAVSLPYAPIGGENKPSGAVEAPVLEAFPLYLLDSDHKDSVKLAFFNGESDIPYIEMEEAFRLVKAASAVKGDKNLSFRVSTESGKQLITVERENGSKAVLDFIRGTIYFADLDSFLFANSSSKGVLETVYDNADDQDRPGYIMHEVSLLSQKGEPVMIGLSDYGISMFFVDGKGYIPLQTLSDIFLKLSYTVMSCSYNGKLAAVTEGSMDEKITEEFYSVKTGTRSASLADFSYRELCLALDFNYGLKKQHNIQSFDEFFRRNGMYENLTGADPFMADYALQMLTFQYMDDMHSVFRQYSCLAGNVMAPSDELQSKMAAYPIPFGANILANSESKQPYAEAQQRAYPDGIPGYEVVGNTAYVTIYGFTLPFSNPGKPDDIDYRVTKPVGPMDAGSDTFGLISYAHEQIMKNDRIENVVLDLSLNGGGLLDSAVFVSSWFLGKADIKLTNALTGAKGITRYRADVNFDGQFDDGDTLAGKKRLFCLISPVSFSCGNLVPALFDETPAVTLLGRRSGGGTCASGSLTTAYGSSFNISSLLTLCTMKNGSFYDIDRGVTPDIPIINPDNFYDRKALTELINTLY